jgi:hypothetical protein
LANWKSKLDQSAANNEKRHSDFLSSNPVDLTIDHLFNGLRPTQLWSVLAANLGLFVSAFVAATKFTGG